MGEPKRIARRAAAAVVLAAGCTSLSESSPDRAASGIGPGSASAAPGTYAYAVQTRAPHTCRLSVPSFFGERLALEAYVEGEDFEAVESDDQLRFVRLNGIGYGWIGEATPPVVNKIRLDDYKKAYERLMRHPPPRWDNFFVFVEPDPHDPCVPASSRPILVPEREQRDLTDALVAKQHEYFAKAVEALEKLPFTLLLPDPSLAKRFPDTRGGASQEGYGLGYLAHASQEGGESSQLHIGFTAHSENSPASHCGKPRPAKEPRRNRPDCVLLLTTSRGYEVFRDFEVAGSSSRDTKLPNYYSKVGEALVHLDYPHWKRGANGAMEWAAHEFAEGELEAIFDSLREAPPEDLVRFPGVLVDVEVSLPTELFT